MLRGLIIAAAVAVAPVAAPAQVWDPVPAVDLSQSSSAHFTDAELDVPSGGNTHEFNIPYVLTHFKRVADAVSDGTGAKPRGFIDLPVWRPPEQNQPYNARIMENHLALAYFYTTDRSWNPYYGHTAVRQRLEASLSYLVGMQSGDGRFSESGANNYNLAATAFATKFLGQSLTLLERPGSPTIDPTLLDRVRAADRKAILHVLGSSDYYNHGKSYTNQYGNVWAGGLAYVALYDDAEVRQKLEARYTASRADFQSPAGFFYEADGADWTYNLGTHASNQRTARHYTRGTALGSLFEEDERLYYEWLSYNAVPLPDGSGFVLNRAIETRQRKAFLPLTESSYADAVPITRAFSPTVGEVAARRAGHRVRWSDVPALVVPSAGSYTPYEFLHRGHASWLPSDAERDAARAALPYFADQNFNHQRVDTRGALDPTFTYVRRPGYYAAFNSGDKKASQRLGLGLLWNPTTGAVLQSQTDSQGHAWGTVPSGTAYVYERDDMAATFRVSGTRVSPTVGVRDLPDGDLAVTYALGTIGSKTVTFTADGVGVSVSHAGDFREQLPLLLLPGDDLDVTAGLVTLTRGDQQLRVDIAGGLAATLQWTDEVVGPYTVGSVHISGRDTLSYTIRFVPEPAGIGLVAFAGALALPRPRRNRDTLQ